jgi:hypothetical protein
VQSESGSGRLDRSDLDLGSALVFWCPVVDVFFAAGGGREWSESGLVALDSLVLVVVACDLVSGRSICL